MTDPAPATVTHIVSLGMDCRTAYHLRRHFDFGTAYPFDWWISPQEGAASFLAELDVDALYDPALLEPVIRQGAIQSVRHRRYGIRLPHEFPRDGQGHVIEGSWLAPAQPKARTRKLVDRLLDLDQPGASVLFVRVPGAHETADIDVLARVVRGRFRRATARLLVLDPRGSVPEGVLSATVPDVALTDTEGWRGGHDAWSTALARLPIRFQDVAARPFTWGEDPSHTG